MEGLNRRQFLKLGTVIIATALLDGRVGATGRASWLLPSKVLSEPPVPVPTGRSHGMIKSAELALSPADFKRGESAGLDVSDTGLRLLRQRAGVFTSPVIEAPIPFSAVVPQWVGRAPADAEVRVSVRTSADATTWSHWYAGQLESPYASRPISKHSGRAAIIAPGEHLARYVQFRIEMFAEPSRWGEPPLLSDLTLDFIDPGEGPTTDEMLAILGTTAGDLALTQATADKPPILSRTAWGCPDGQSSPNAPPEYKTVTHLVIHHTESDNGITDWAQHVRLIWQIHAVTWGWGDIGYNYLIDPNGVIYEGRAGGDDVVGFHVYGFNSSGTMGVACLGTYSTVGISSSMRTSLERLMAWKCSQRGLDPTGIRSIVGYTSCDPLAVNLPTILGHRDFPGHNTSYPYHCNAYGATACPGNNLESTIPAIRTAVASRLNPPDTTPPVATMGSIARYVKTTSFTVRWTGTDASGIKCYDVQYRIGASGTWTNWLSGTTATWATFSGQNGTTYYFRCRATDNANNTGNWSAEVLTTVDTSPPTCGIVDLSPQPTKTWFVFQCWGWDGIAGVKAFDVDYRDLTTGSAWQAWVRGADSGNGEGASGFVYREFLFAGTAGHRYEFRCRAYDHAGNVSDNGGWSTDTAIVATGLDSSGLYKVRLPLVMRNSS